MEESDKKKRRPLVVVALLVLVLTLFAVVVYLLSDLNHHRYRLGAHDGMLVVERGRFFPIGFSVFEPDEPALKSGYAPIPLPSSEAIGPAEIFEDRSDIDRTLFALLAGWARQRLDSRDTAQFDLGVSYVRRCELLPGLSEEQRHDLRVLRGDVAYKHGRRLLANLPAELDRALVELQSAKELGTSRPQEIDGLIAQVKDLRRELKQAFAPQGPPPSAPPVPEVEEAPALPEQTPPSEEGDDRNPPKWRL